MLRCYRVTICHDILHTFLKRRQVRCERHDFFIRKDVVLNRPFPRVDDNMKIAIMLSARTQPNPPMRRSA